LTHGVNYFREDRPFQEMLRFLKWKARPDLEALGSFVGTELLEAADWIDRGSRPFLQTWGVRGHRLDWVRISPEHRRVLQRLRELGAMSIEEDANFPLQSHFLGGYVISDAGLFCSVTLTAQTAWALYKYGDEGLKGRHLPSLLDRSGTGAWGATFYTEIQGGSDLGANETVARRVGDSWRLWGSGKSFASNAGLADLALVTAKPDPPRPGPRGIALFLVPSTTGSGEANFRIRRLRDKTGTRAVPTGEVELDGSEGFLLGRAEEGLFIALEVLNIARVDNALASIGLARKALWEASRYAAHRRAFGKTLREHPLLLRDLAEMEAEVEVGLLLALQAARAVSQTARDRPPYSPEYFQARIWTHVAKALTAWMAQEVTRKCLEILGGMGFLEEFPLARLHREALVTSIWEGTSNIQALELLDLLRRPAVREGFLDELDRRVADLPSEGSLRNSVKEESHREREWLKRRDLSSPRMEFFAKDLLTRMGHLLSTVFFAEWTGEANAPPSRRALLNLYGVRSRFSDVPDIAEESLREALDWMSAPPKDSGGPHL
jgi:acyl-CoA dehydrogenase